MDDHLKHLIARFHLDADRVTAQTIALDQLLIDDKPIRGMSVAAFNKTYHALGPGEQMLQRVRSQTAVRPVCVRHVDCITIEAHSYAARLAKHLKLTHLTVDVFDAPTTDLWRVEHPVSGYGPINGDDLDASIRAEIKRAWNSDPDLTAVRREFPEDYWGGGGFYDGCLVACESLEHLARWVGPFMDQLTDAGYALVQYRANASSIISGKLQSIALPHLKHSIKIASTPLAELDDDHRSRLMRPALDSSLLDIPPHHAPQGSSLGIVTGDGAQR